MMLRIIFLPFLNFEIQSITAVSKPNHFFLLTLNGENRL